MFVTLVRVIDGTRAAISVRTVGQGNLSKAEGLELDFGQHLRMIDLQTDADVSPKGTRDHLEAAAKMLNEGEIAVAPKRYNFVNIVSSEDMVGRINYAAVDMEMGLPQDGVYGGRKSAPINVEAVLAAAKIVRPVDERAGKPTKAAQVRAIMREELQKKAGPESIVQRIMSECGFGKGNAGIYFKNNLKQVMGELA